jgi:hypothetical protein
MAGRRQAMCRYCYNYGHTKRTCPNLKEYVKNNPSSYLADNLKSRCSYCKETGHTRRKCEQLAARNREKRLQLLETRTQICQALSELGISPGALIRAEVYIREGGRGSWRKIPLIVNRVTWDNIRNNMDNMIEVVNPIEHSIQCVRPPRHHLLNNSWYDECEVISPICKDVSMKYNFELMEKFNEKVIKEYL